MEVSYLSLGTISTHFPHSFLTNASEICVCHKCYMYRSRNLIFTHNVTVLFLCKQQTWILRMYFPSFLRPYNSPKSTSFTQKFCFRILSPIKMRKQVSRPWIQKVNNSFNICSLLTPRRWCLHLIVVVGFEWSWDPVSCAGGSVATGRATHAGQVKTCRSQTKKDSMDLQVGGWTWC
jgi:hypothetical protein